MAKLSIGRVKKAGALVWKWFRRAVMFGVITILVIGLIVFVFPDSTLKWTANAWSRATAPPENSADAILVLGGGSAFRPQAAAELWHAGHAPKIYVFDPLSDFSSKEGNMTMRLLQEELNVPPDSIELIESQVTSTFDEANITAELIRSHGWKSVIVPTHIFHTRRVEWIFSKHLPDDCELYVTEAPFIHFRAEDWWKNEWGLIQFPNEVLKTIFYGIRY